MLMATTYVIKVGELILKQGNRQFFERKLFQNIKAKLKDLRVTISGREGRYILNSGDAPKDMVERALSTSFGLVSFSPVRTPPKEIERILDSAVSVARAMVERYGLHDFKIAARRSDKSFPHNSYEIACLAGDRIREACPGTRVKLQNPSFSVFIEIRDRVLVYGNGMKGPGGLPVGCAGRGMLLLSGGIDSPVAGYRMAGRGLKLEAVYFDAFPFTSREAREKVETLGGLISPWLHGLVLHIPNFKDVQTRIKERAPDEELTLHLRASMMRCAELIAERRSASCLVTGESLSQVASQTVQSMHFTGSVVSLPVFRPLIGTGKEEIITLAKKIGTYDTSILPHDDCCTLFAPDHPLIRPDFEKMRQSFLTLELDELIQKAADDAEKVCFGTKERAS